MVIYMYIAPGQGQTTHWVINPKNINLVSLWSFAFYNFITVVPIQTNRWSNFDLSLKMSRSTQGYH